MLSPKALFVFCLALLASVMVHGVKIREVQGRQHPDTHVDGFVLKSVFIPSLESDTVVRRMLRFDDNPHLREVDAHRASRELKQATWPDFSATTNSKARVVALAKLNLLAYDEEMGIDSFYSEAVMSEIYENQESIFGTATTSRSAEQQELRDFRQVIEDEITATAAEDAVTYGATYSPESTQLEGTTVLSSGQGVAAYEFARGNVSVVAFRGTATDGDYKNIYNWLHDWVLEKMTDKMESIWTDDAGLEWTDELKDRSNKGTSTSSAGICAFNWLSAGLGSELSDETDDLTQDEAESTGYWEITKAVTDAVFAEAQSSGGSLLLSGHSQGGTRGALASMYLKKSEKQLDGEDVQAVTFAATGSQCVARLLHSDADLTDDVNPYILHPQITEYVHVLDPWGQALGQENGNVCLYGLQELEQSSAYKYCSRVWGNPGENLWFNEGADAVSFFGWSLQDEDLLLNMKRCRYFTHFMEAMVLALTDGDVLAEDGTILAGKGSCAAATVATEADPTEVCPDPDHSTCSDALAMWIVVLIVVLVALCCCCAGGVYFMFCRNKGAPSVRTEAAGYSQPQQAPAPDSIPMAYNAEPPTTGPPVAQNVQVDGYQPALYPKM